VFTGWDPAITVALIVTAGTVAGGFGTFVSNIFSTRSANKQRQLERAEDRKDRADVADQAERTARLLVESNLHVANEAKTTATAIIESNEVIKSDIAEVHDLGVKTHSLVNSAMTAVKQAELDGLVRELDGLLRERALMDRILGISQEDKISVDQRIADRRVEITSRQTDITDRAKAAEVQIAAAAAAADR
jgi:hypothetical protein